MNELLTVGPFTVIFWVGVIKWIRYMDTRDLLEAVRPNAADVAAIEATLPKFGEPR